MKDEIKLVFMDIGPLDLLVAEREEGSPMLEWYESELNTVCRAGWKFEAVLPGPDSRGYLVFLSRPTN